MTRNLTSWKNFAGPPQVLSEWLPGSRISFSCELKPFELHSTGFWKTNVPGLRNDCCPPQLTGWDDQPELTVQCQCSTCVIPGIPAVQTHGWIIGMMSLQMSLFCGDRQLGQLSWPRKNRRLAAVHCVARGRSAKAVRLPRNLHNETQPRKHTSIWHRLKRNGNRTVSLNVRYIFLHRRQI